MSYKETPFIFFLNLEETLPESFYIFDRNFKDLGFILIPVKIDQLQSLSAATHQEEIIVICSVVGSREFKIFNQKVRNLFKFVLKSKRITMMHLSSFSRLDDTKLFAHQKNYYFMKFPLDAGLLSAMIARYYNLKSKNSSKWPGGKRAGVLGMAA